MPIQRMRAEDLLAAVFPEQVQCQDNRMGPITPPDHPLVKETIRNCLYEAMDLEALQTIVGALERGELETVAVETPAPSPISHEILNANPYAFLDDAPLEERRARAVALRRTDPDLAKGVGALDPAAIAEVSSQAWPDVRSADELHDHLLTVGLLPVEENGTWEGFAAELLAAQRATIATWADATGVSRRAYVAAERLHLARVILPTMQVDPEITEPTLRSGRVDQPADEAIRTVVHGWVQCLGPATAATLARRIGLPTSDVEIALASLEGAGVVLRGQFTRSADGVEWCERRVLSRIHRLTLGRLRREIEAVSAAEFMRFLFRWQHVQPGTQLHGRDGVLQVLGQLQGLELPAPAWEEYVLPSRIKLYDPADLEYLCLSGMVTWGRLLVESPGTEPSENGSAERPKSRRGGLARNAPIGFLLREDLSVLLAGSRTREEILQRCSSAAQEIAYYLKAHGASFQAEIVRGTRLLPSEVDQALWELVARGLLSGDGVAGLRRLLHGGTRSHNRQRRLRALTGGRGHLRPLPVGRWALWQTDLDPAESGHRNEAIARQLLRRYGVVFRDLLARERVALPWRILLPMYRQWEARGEVRGGRFVAGFVGEQFALPQAVDALRAVRRSPEESDAVVLSTADPLNLVGILLPGNRVAPTSGLGIAHRNGAPVDVGPMGVVLSRLQRTRIPHARFPRGR
jgi:ATP-dependent Lhr-like helicase